MYFPKCCRCNYLLLLMYQVPNPECLQVHSGHHTHPILAVVFVCSSFQTAPYLFVSSVLTHDSVPNLFTWNSLSLLLHQTAPHCPSSKELLSFCFPLISLPSSPVSSLSLSDQSFLFWSPAQKKS